MVGKEESGGAERNESVGGYEAADGGEGEEVGGSEGHGDGV